MIEFRHLTKAYRTTRGSKVIVDDLTLTLPRGAKVGVLGRNGAGKSTLIGMIAGLAGLFLLIGWGVLMLVYYNVRDSR